MKLSVSLADIFLGTIDPKKKIEMTAPVLQQSEKIAMTTPVLLNRNQEGFKMRFILPSKYQMEDLPVPTDPDVTFQEIPPKRYAVVRFSGKTNPTKAQKFENSLKQWLEDKKLVTIGSAILAQYDPPYTLWFLRRNEILLEIQ